MTFRITQRIGRRAATLTAVAVVGVILTGCSPAAPTPTATADAAASAAPTASAEPTPTPTPTARTWSAPTSAEEAIAGAMAAMQEFLVIRAEIELEHPGDASAYDTILADSAATTMHAGAEHLHEHGMVSTGHYGYEQLPGSYTVEATLADGAVLPFGGVYLAGCFDYTAITVSNADGSPVALGEPRTTMTVVATYRSDSLGWIIQRFEAPEKTTC